MTASSSHRLDGLEPDNLLAFLALLGLLRSLEADDRQCPDREKTCPRACWELDGPPLRPRLFLQISVTTKEVAERAARGLRMLAEAHEFDGRKDLNYSRSECRALLDEEANRARLDARTRIDLLSALMSDAAIKDLKTNLIDPTPFCLLFGQGHQHFLDRLSKVVRDVCPVQRGRGKAAVKITDSECLSEALFAPWHYQDPTFSFRWDPAEDVRYALLAGDPTDGAYKGGTQHGANRLAAVGFAALTLVPELRAGRVRPRIIGGISNSEGFSFAWPIWREPASLRSVSALLTHPKLKDRGALAHLGVEHVLEARRVPVGKFMNFTRARYVY